MKKTVLIPLMIMLSVSCVMAKGYTTAIGIRGGLSNGLTIKHFQSSDTALEGIIGTRWGGLSLTGLYEIHKPALDVNNLFWYYGFGGHIGFWRGNDVNWAKDNDNYTVIGIDGILGLEYNIKEIPFNISFDWKPAFNLTGHSGLWGDEAAISIRYIFK